MVAQNSEIVNQYRPIDALTPAHWQLNSVVTGDNARLYYHRTGNGSQPPILALHGFQAAGLMWLRVARALEADYDVILPDFRGHGYSSASTKGFSLERLTQDMAELINELGLAKTFVIGHSMGAEVAGRLAAEHPEMVRAVVLVDPPMRAFSVSPAFLKSDWYKQWIVNLQAIKTQPHAERMRTGLQLLPPNLPIPGEEDYVPYVEAQAQLDLNLLQAASVMNYQVATPDIADQITSPLLLVTGNPQRGSGATQEGIAVLTAGPQREAASFQDAGHFVQVEQFEKFIQTTLDFMKRH